MGLVEHERQVIWDLELACRHSDLERLLSDRLEAIHGPDFQVNVARKALKAALCDMTKHKVLALRLLQCVSKASILLRAGKHLDRNALNGCK